MASVGDLAVAFSKIRLDVHYLDISVERKSVILVHALASHADVLRGSSRVPVPLTTLFDPNIAKFLMRGI